MPDQRKHRGPHPDDQRVFACEYLEPLRRAVGEVSWLRSRGYAPDSALKLVGDRHELTSRQRMAVRRAACSDRSLERRRQMAVTVDQLAGQPIAVDGYNVLITVESALAGGAVFVGRDGCYRDLASVHGTFRKVEETIPALTLIIDFLTCCQVTHVDWLLDKPVSNSGRLKAVLADLVETQRVGKLALPPWNIELVNDPDAVLLECEGAVATADSVILDRCRAWANLATWITADAITDAWIVDLRSAS